MGTYRAIYDLAAKAGALEGYVYHQKNVDPGYLPAWTENLVNQYNALSTEIRAEIQEGCDETLGRAVQSLIPVLGEDHEVVKKLKGLIKGALPSSPDDFPIHR